MKNNLGIYLFCACLGYVWGWDSDFSGLFAPSQEAGSSSQSSTAQEALNKYENLPCPTEAVFLELAQYVKLEIPPGKSLDEDCGVNNPRAILGKSLFLMNSLKFHFPQSWPAALKKNLENPLRFLHERSAKLSLDLNQKDSLAYNKVDIKEIFLGGRYFTIDPLSGIAVLIHEARHSEPPAATHTHCEAGDIPRTGGACDEMFTMDNEKAGAYAYGTLFNLALAFYAEGLAQSDREIALADALVELAARFNNLPDIFAVKHDVLVTLQADGTLSWIHPVTRAEKNIELKFLDRERPRRIEFYPKNNGLLIYTNLDRLYSWHPVTGQTNVYPDLISAQDGVRDMARLRVPFGEMTLYAMRDANNNLSFIEYSPQDNKQLRKPYPKSPTRRSENDFPTSPFHRMFLALFNESVHLTKDGKLYMAQHYGNENAFIEHKHLQSPQGWVAGTGGVLYDTLYLIDQRGDLKQVAVGFEDREDGADVDKVMTVQDSLLKHSAPLTKFVQGLAVQMGLDRNGELQVWGVDSLESKKLELSHKVEDFVLMQILEVKPVVSEVPSDFQNIWKDKAAASKPYQRP